MLPNRVPVALARVGYWHGRAVPLEGNRDVIRFQTREFERRRYGIGVFRFYHTHSAGVYLVTRMLRIKRMLLPWME